MNYYRNIKLIIKKIYTHWIEHDIAVYSAFFSYYLVISFFPFAIISIIIISYTPLIDGYKLESLIIYFPDTARVYIENLLNDIISNNRQSILSASIIGIIWAASKAFSALIKVIDKAYGNTEKRNYFLVILHSIGFSLVMAVLFAVYILIVVLGDGVGEYLMDKIGHINIYDNFKNTFKFGAPIILTFVASIYIYYIIPKKKFKFKEILPGGIFLTIGFMVISMLFSMYINNFSNYNKLYGGVAGIVILLLWLNLLSTIIMIGAEINAVIKYKEK
ncbi:MAG: YihY/virulence factor BrkB family protein [Clostridiales bacterium]